MKESPTGLVYWNNWIARHKSQATVCLALQGRIMLKKFILLIWLFILITACGSNLEDVQPTPEPPVRILIIGDSYVENHGGLDTHVVGLANSNQPSRPVEGKNIAKGGAPLSEHWQSGFAVSMIQSVSLDQTSIFYRAGNCLDI